MRHSSIIRLIRKGELNPNKPNEIPRPASADLIEEHRISHVDHNKYKKQE